MSFIIKKVSDVGTSNPIVARMSIQFNDIMNFYSLEKSQKESINAILRDDIQKRLLTCENIAHEITTEILETLTTIQTSGLKTQSGGRVVESPHIIRLEERIETYLYNAKSCLRDALKIYNVVFGTNFTEARYDQAIKWGIKEFGAKDNLTKFLKNNHDNWVQKIVKMRNATEHPGGHSGHLHIQNFEVTTNSGKTIITEPTWNLNDDSPSLLRKDLLGFIGNILELTEDIVLSSLAKLEKTRMVEISEIPINKRRDEAPIRFEIGLAT